MNLLLIPIAFAQAQKATDQTTKGTDYIASVFDIISRVIVVGIIVAVSIIIAKIVLHRVILAIQKNQTDEKDHKEILVLSNRLIYASFTILGTLFGLGITGLSGELTWLFGAVGLGIGFALQTIVGNYIAGLTLLTQRKMKMNDLVEINGFRGVITNIGTRAVVLHDLKDGTDIFIPNMDFFKNSVRVLTANPFRRVWVEIGVGYDTDFPKAYEKILEILKRYPDIVLQEPAPDVLMTEVKASCVNLRIRWWIPSDRRWWSIRSNVLRDVFVELQDIGVDISFPITTLRVDSHESDALFDYLKHDQMCTYEGPGIRKPKNFDTKTTTAPQDNAKIEKYTMTE